MANKNFSLILDIIAKLDNDEVKKAFSELEKAAEKVNSEFENIDMSKLLKSVGELENALNNTDIDNFDSEVKKLAVEFDNVRKEAQELLNTQKLALQAMELSGKEGTDSYKRLAKEIQDTENKLSELGITADKAGDKTSSIGDKLAKFGMMTQGIEQITNTMDQFSKPFIELDTATNRIKTLGGAAKDAAPQFREMSLEMAKKMPIGAEALQTATYDALSAGISATKEDISAFMDASAKLAVGGGEEIGNTVNLLSSMVNAYGESASKTGEYSDIIFQTVNAGKTTVQELSSSLSQVVPTAAAYGFSLKNVGGALALMTSNGIPTAAATTKLNQLMLEMQKPGKELEGILNKAGVSVESLGKKVKSGDVIGALKDMDEAFKKSGVSATQAFSSAESGAAFNVLTKDFGKLESTLKGFDAASGSTEKAYKDMMGSIENQTKLFKSQMDVAFIGAMDSMGPLGPAIMGIGQSLMQVAPLITSVSGLSNLIPEGAIESASKYAKQIISSIVPGLTAQAGATGGATIAQTGLNAAISSNPIAAIIIGVAALATALYLFATKTEAGRELFEKFKEGLGALWNYVRPAFEALLGAGKEVLNFLGTLGEFLYEYLITPFEMGAKIISGVISWFLQFIGVGKSTSGVIGAVSEAFNWAGKAIGKVTETLQWLLEKFREAKQIMFNFVQAVPEIFSLLFEYAKYYLNPANWIDGDDKYEAMLSKKFDNLLGKITNTAKEATKKSGETNAAIAQQIGNAVVEANNKVTDSEGKKGKATKDANKEKKSAIELANEEYGIQKKILEEANKQYEIDAEKVRLAQKRSKNNYDELASQEEKIRLIEKEKDAYEEAYKKVFSIDKETGEINFSPKIKDTDKAKITSEWNGFKQELQSEENKKESIKIKIGVDKLEFQKDYKEFQKQKMKYEVEYGFKLIPDALSNALYEHEKLTKELNALIEKRDDLQILIKTTPSAISDEELEDLNKKILAKEKEAFNKEKEIDSDKKELQDNYLAYVKKSQADELKAIDEQYNEYEEKFKKVNNAWKSRDYDSEKNSALSEIDESEKNKIAELEKLRDSELISAETFESKKTKIVEAGQKEREAKEKEYRQKKLATDNMLAGMEIELQRVKEADKAKVTQTALKKEIALLKSKPDLTVAEQDKLKELETNLDDVNKILEVKGTKLDQSLALMADGFTTGINNLFSGDTEGAKQALRNSFAQIFGVWVEALKKEIDGVVLSMVLDLFKSKETAALPFLARIALLPIAQAAASEAVNAIASPVIEGLSSYSTGGRIDKPTAILAGDGARLNGRNREWWTTDEQLKGIIKMANGSNNSLSERRLASIENLLASQTLETKLKGRDIVISQKRIGFDDNRRARG